MRIRTVLCTSIVVLALALGMAPRARAADHPLEPLSVAEMRTTYDVVRAHFAANGLPTQPLLFPAIMLDEPAKAAVLAWAPGRSVPRVARAQVMHYPSNRLWVAMVDLDRGRVTSLQLMPRGTQAPVTAEEFIVADQLVHADPAWQAAMRARGVDPDLVYVDVWAPGDLEVPPDVAATLPDGQKTRLLRCIAYHRGAPLDAFDDAAPQNPYDRPIEGVVVTVDMNRRRVVHMTDTLRTGVSTETGNAAVRRPPLRPLRAVQPSGGNVRVSGRRVTWQNWSFYVALSPREGLVIYDVRYADRGQLRPVAYRLSLSEVYVPYAVADTNWVWRTAFDVGEYYLGLYAQTLEVNRDVPENAVFVDAVFATDVGPTPDNPTGTVDFPATLALYERDGGILWTRTDPSNYVRDTRFGRDLVVTWNAWIGNYIYGFDWIFKMDGSIEVRVNAAGTTVNRGAPPADEPSAPLVAIDTRGTRVSAPNHQHFWSFRLDLDVDGTANTVAQSNVAHLPTPGFKNVFAARETPIAREGFDDVNPASSRTWHVRSATQRNRLGELTSYELVPGETAVPYSADDFEPLARAQFAKHAVWVTRHKDGELHAAGDFPNQGNAGDGLAAFVSPPEPLGAGDDVVVWYTAGFTHITRPEDYPVMPTGSVGFKLMPHGFFDRNPALDAPDQARHGP